MILSGHQPVYLPGIILFNKIALSDAFMFVGHCQYTQRSWQTRNRIRMGDDEQWLSVPVKKSGRFGQSINDTEILDDYWKKKHLATIRQAYGKRPYVDSYYPQLEELILKDTDRLGDLNIAITGKILEWLAIFTKILDSRNYPIEGHKTDMLISMCRAVGADEYLSNQGSRDYVDEKSIAESGIQHSWQVFEHPVYEQGRPFMENLSVIDLLFNVGPAAREIIRRCGRVEPGHYRPGKGQAHA
jgi:WbqC-like protein family